MTSSPHDDLHRGFIAWMVHNRVTSNILMWVLLIGGVITSIHIKQEVYPEFSLDMVTVEVPYSGAGPEEVEQGIVLAIEEAVRGVEGVKEIRAIASEGFGTVTIELLAGADRQKSYQDVQQAIDRIITFPEEAEQAQVTLNTRRYDVLDIEVYGDVSEMALRNAAEHVRDRLLQSEQITQIELDGARDYEIHIEVSQENLRRYGLTLSDIALKVRRSALELPGGKIETRGGEVLLRVAERRDWAREFARIPMIAGEDGTLVSLWEIAHVFEGFEDTEQESSFNGTRSIGIDVFRVGDQTPISISDAARSLLPQIESEFPPGINLVLRYDDADAYRQRLELLLKNAFIGLVLVLLLLGLFLEFKLAFWVTMGIPISFLGGLLFLPLFGVTINMISMFAFIVALGIVVDDAIVAGENIYEYRQRGMGAIEAAVRGARDITVPVVFAISTNVVAFAPLLFVPGVMGKVWGVIPVVVCTVFVISLFEALFILPCHLAHTRSEARTGLTRMLHRRQQAFSEQVRRFIYDVYGPFLHRCLRYRVLTVAIGMAVLILSLSYAASGRLGFILMPRVESDRSMATATLPPGTPIERVREVREELVASGRRVVEAHGNERLSTGVFTEIENDRVRVMFHLTDPDTRPISTMRFTRLWREQTETPPGVTALRYESDRGGPGSGAGLTIELSHRDIETLDRAGAALADRLGEFSVVKDVDDGYSAGKRQHSFQITPEGESLGITAEDLANQVRNAFQGARPIRQQRGRNEVTVRVRLPRSQRDNAYEIEQMIVRTPDGGQAPLMDVATVEHGRAFTEIQRRDGRRILIVTADVEPIGETARVQSEIDTEIIPQLTQEFPGLTYGYEGRQADLKDSFNALVKGLGLALLIIYILLAIPFRSYVEPLIVMMAIPFGLVGAVLGHLLMGYDLSMISIMGIVALSGVVVNDSLVLIDATNRLRQQDRLVPVDAIHQAALRRFRPILLTTLTTFGGLAPMIFETSFQARFMIPMAISLGYGILFATFVTLLILPCFYLLLNDVTRVFQTPGGSEGSRS